MTASRADATKETMLPHDKAEPPQKTKPKPEPSAADLLARLDHPLKADIETVRKAVLAADKSVADGVKWNSLSFRTTEWFATVNLRSRDSLQLVLHLGARAGKTASRIEDPKGLLKWLGKDRAIATLGVGPQVKASIPAFKAIAKSWIGQVRPDADELPAPAPAPATSAVRKRPSTGRAR